ncbi:hypothetical protein I2483_03620 [Sporosarcina sp. E16_3]|uniref:hypothetical protein n=1 Tax=Sporosarcina sp. E16_3 TaxID=2789293 RepID=UPI001A9310AA|nr:hypothetical protein [Sporosarcina sp. E16_3]MBO0600741.1 hypothetical protein [Sporosarcina sp. E16_3]
MKGKNLVIGLVLLTILSIIAIYFTMKATVNNMENGMAPIVTVVELIEEVDYR